MALSGVHIVFGYAGAALVEGGGALPFVATASDTMAPGSPGTSAKVAPEAPVGRHAMLSITASLAIFYAVGPSPDAVAGPRRYYDPAFGTADIIVNSGDKFAWVAG